MSRQSALLEYSSFFGWNIQIITKQPHLYGCKYTHFCIPIESCFYAAVTKWMKKFKRKEEKINKSIYIYTYSVQTRNAGSFNLFYSYLYAVQLCVSMGGMEEEEEEKIRPRFKDDYSTCFMFSFSLSLFYFSF